MRRSPLGMANLRTINDEKTYFRIKMVTIKSPFMTDKSQKYTMNFLCVYNSQKSDNNI